MYKENGRLGPADEKELAHELGKEFECWKCGHIEVRKNVEFGTTIKCPVCNIGDLVEKIDLSS